MVEQKCDWDVKGIRSTVNGIFHKQGIIHLKIENSILRVKGIK